jgi:hypothetical protein
MWRTDGSLVYLKFANTRISLHEGLTDLSVVFGRFMNLSDRFDSFVVT